MCAARVFSWASSAVAAHRSPAVASTWGGGLQARAAAGLTPQSEGPSAALAPGLGAGKAGQAPLHSAWEQSAVMVGADLKDLLEGRNGGVAAGAQARGGGSDEEGGEGSEEEGGEAEPRWKEARREKRQRQRAEKKAGRAGASADEEDGGGSDEEEEEAPARKTKKKKKALARRAGGAGGSEADVLAGEDEVGDFELSSDEG